MPASRKKSQGKERKAKAKSGSCTHGMPNAWPQGCTRFMGTFHDELRRLSSEIQDVTALKGVMYALDATRAKHQDVWLDTSLREVVKTCFTKLGTDQVLKQEQGAYDFAAALAVGIMRLEDEESRNDDLSSWSILDCKKGRSKIRDMILSSPQATVKFYHKLAPCSCLDKLHSEVKSQTKTAQCIHCDTERERSAMFLCGNCRIHQYCSKKCQREAWAIHKPICERLCQRFGVAPSG